MGLGRRVFSASSRPSCRPGRVGSPTLAAGSGRRAKGAPGGSGQGRHCSGTTPAGGRLAWRGPEWGVGLTRQGG